jgi:hypothetical protein
MLLIASNDSFSAPIWRGEWQERVGFSISISVKADVAI